MNRQEAAKILCEVMKKCNGSMLTKHVSLAHNKSYAGSIGYELHIGIEPDDYLVERIGAVLEKYNLSIKASAKTLIIYKPADSLS